METPFKKFTKAEVDYGPSSAPACRRCGICSFLLGPCGAHECGIVEGSIEPMDGCKKFDKDLIKDALHILPKD